jgi:type IV pilus assembly protein PilB
VFSTLHTNDAIGAIPRLLDLGVPDYLVAATVEAVLAQRLVRRICSECRVAYSPGKEQLAAFADQHTAVSLPEFLRGAGCSFCRGTGFRGRLGVFELLTMTDNLKDAVSRQGSRAMLKTLSLEGGLHPLRQDGWFKVSQGHTTVEEILRVVQD